MLSVAFPENTFDEPEIEAAPVASSAAGLVIVRISGAAASTITERVISACACFPETSIAVILRR